jgi:hypothetical protein
MISDQLPVQGGPEVQLPSGAAAVHDSHDLTLGVQPLLLVFSISLDHKRYQGDALA